MDPSDPVDSSDSSDSSDWGRRAGGLRSVFAARSHRIQRGRDYPRFATPVNRFSSAVAWLGLIRGSVGGGLRGLGCGLDRSSNGCGGPCEGAIQCRERRFAAVSGLP